MKVSLQSFFLELKNVLRILDEATHCDREEISNQLNNNIAQHTHQISAQVSQNSQITPEVSPAIAHALSDQSVHISSHTQDPPQGELDNMLQELNNAGTNHYYSTLPHYTNT